MPRHKTKDKGDLAVAKAASDLIKAGFRTCLPISEHLPFDFIAIAADMTTLLRMQVKFRSPNAFGAIQLVFRANYYDSRKIYQKYVDLSEIDAYAVYCPETNAVYYIRVDELRDEARAITLRLEPPKNHQLSGIRLASNYIDPNRLIDKILTVPLSRRDIILQDEFAIEAVIEHLLSCEVQPMLVRSQYVPFDLVAVLPDMKTMYRVRVGYGRIDPNPYVDLYAVYDESIGSVRYVLPQSTASNSDLILQGILPVENSINAVTMA
ncbi:MAG: hypothetical protein OHK0046_09860 [Anaerolineae bacterium]